ncbi:uncharacterized protein METZ01_LOCUS96184 [marine metagenome]|uniref:Tyrosine kinase G-rich domain-containing protein n=1 Tax=marine metagenome TaxID=408172 RepID=A0A381VSQ6_9ZZZZ
MIKLTPHEEKILLLVKSNPDIVTNSQKRAKVAKEYGLSEKTLRNRIGDLKKYGIIKENNTNTDLNNKPELGNDINEITILEIVSILLKNRISIIKSVFFVTVTSAIISFLIPLTYQSSAVLMPPSSESNTGIIGSISDLPLGGLLSQSNDETLKMIAILKSRTVMENVIRKFNLINFYQVENIEEALELLKDYTIFEVEEEGTIRISVNVSTGWFHPNKEEEKTKKLSADIANYFVEQLDSINKNLKTEQASFHRQFIGERYQQNISDLRIAEDSLKTFQEKHKMIALSEQTTVAIEVAASLKGQILANEVKLGVMGSTLNSEHPDIEKLKKENYELQKKMNELEYGAEVVHIDQKNLFPVFSDIPELGVQLLRLKREVEIQNTLFIFLTQQYEEAKIQEAKNTPTVQVLDYALIPNIKYKPVRSRLLIIAFALSSIFSMYFVYFRARWEIAQAKITS